MDFLKIVKQYEQNIMKDLQILLAMDTVLVETPENKEAPFGKGIKEALDWILAKGEEMGFTVLNVDNVAGHIEFGEGDDIIGILCHIDVVPTGDGWTYPPFSATIVGDKLFARGAMDDKGPVISSLYAMKMIKDLGVKLNKRVRLIIGTDEETHWRGVERYFQVCEMPSIGFSPDAEFPLIYGEKGILSIDLDTSVTGDIVEKITSGDRYNVVPEYAEAILNRDITKAFFAFCQENNLKGTSEIIDNRFKLAVQGKSAHAMEPDKGINALVWLCRFLVSYSTHPLVLMVGKCLTDSRFKALGLDYTNQAMGDLTVNVAFFKQRDHVDVVGLNLRYPIDWPKEAFVEKLTKVAIEYGVNLRLSKDITPHFISKDSPLVQTLHQAYIKYTNDTNSPLKTIGGGTYARALRQGVAFGMLMPNREEVVHEVDEYLHLSDLFVSTAIYAQSIIDLGIKK